MLAMNCAMVLALGACTSSRRPDVMDGHATQDTERISDAYRRIYVKSYQVFEWPVTNHVMALIRLKSGRQLPMLCQRFSDSVYPIRQSVFSTTDKTKFYIMCEPLMQQRDGSEGYAMMRILVTVDKDSLSTMAQKMPIIEPKPRLVDSPKASHPY